MAACVARLSRAAFPDVLGGGSTAAYRRHLLHHISGLGLVVRRLEETGTESLQTNDK
jgi:hypothetical protein